MILQALYRLAQREGLMLDPDYEPKPVAWLVRVSKEGKFLGFTGTHYSELIEGRKKPNISAKSYPLPREKAVTSGDRAFLLFGKAEYVFGQDPGGKEEQNREPSKLLNRFNLFKERVKKCYEATGDEGAKAVLRLIEDIAAGIQTIALPQECRSNDLFTFVYSPDGDRLVLERDRIRDYWKRLRQTGVISGTRRNICLISGEITEQEIDNFPKIMKVPGGTPSGVALVSFNKSAFESYGWQSNDNAPISRSAAEACSTALNRLLHPAYPDPRQPGLTLPQRYLRLSADTAVCFWSAEGGGEEFTSVFAGLLEGNPETVKNLYQSVWRGRLPGIENPSAFYALTLTGTQGRVIVRDWFESTISAVARNLATHFSDLDIVRNTPKPRDRDLPPQIPISVILKSLAPHGDSELIPPPLIGEMIESALHGTLYPFSILQRALERTRAEIAKSSWSDLERRDARAALIKAVLNRRKRFYSGTCQYKEVTRDMDPNNKNEGYLLGRIIAIIERMQQMAMSDINASVIDRYFASASAAPRSVFPRLLKNMRYHARKAKDDPRSAHSAGWLEGQLDKILADIKSFPAYLSLDQQGLFVLGYHHQRNWLWTKKEDRDA